MDGFRLNTVGVRSGLDREAVEIGLQRLGGLGQVGGEALLKMHQVHPIAPLSFGAESAAAEHKFPNSLVSQHGYHLLISAG